MNIEELGHTIAEHLTDWHYQDVPEEYQYQYLPSNRCQITNGTQTFWLEIADNKVSAFGDYPKLPQGYRFLSNHLSARRRLGSPRASCSVSRTPESIAKDIERRFIPKFMEVWDACQEEIESRVVAHQSLIETLERIGEDTNAKIGGANCSFPTLLVDRMIPDGPWAKIEPSTDTFTISIHCANEELASKIAKLLKG